MQLLMLKYFNSYYHICMGILKENVPYVDRGLGLNNIFIESNRYNSSRIGLYINTSKSNEYPQFPILEFLKS